METRDKGAVCSPGHGQGAFVAARWEGAMLSEWIQDMGEGPVWAGAGHGTARNGASG